MPRTPLLSNLGLLALFEHFGPVSPQHHVTVTTTTTAIVQGHSAPTNTSANAAQVTMPKDLAHSEGGLKPSPIQEKRQTTIPTNLNVEHTRTANTFQICTPVKVNKLKNWLAGYTQTDVEFLVDGFTNGFRIPFSGTRQFRLSKNLQSARDHPNILANKIAVELEAGRVAGPFATPPFDNLQISPLGLVPKKEEGQFRVIHHLSFPDTLSINDGIPDEFCSVSYQNIDTAASLVKFCGQYSYMMKVDIKHAYRIVPIHPDDYELLGFMVDGKYYFDKTLPMGLSYSCALFERISTAIQWIAETKLGLHNCAHILDDFFFVGTELEACKKGLAIFLDWCASVGIPINQSKTVHPCTTISFVGIELDSVLMEKRLPQEKLEKIRAALSLFSRKKKATLKELQSVIGLLNFACAVVVPGRAFLRRIIDLTVGLRKSHHHKRLTKESRADFQAWSEFLEHFNGKSLFLTDHWITTPSLDLFTDASNIGFGGFLAKKYFYAEWPTQWSDVHITVKELFPIVLAIELFSDILTNCCIVFHTDNEAVVHIINKQTSKDTVLMRLVRRMVLHTLKHNILFKAVHIPGLHNSLADSLSRLQVEKFLEDCPYQDPVEIKVPQQNISL